MNHTFWICMQWVPNEFKIGYWNKSLLLNIISLTYKILELALPLLLASICITNTWLGHLNLNQPKDVTLIINHPIPSSHFFLPWSHIYKSPQNIKGYCKYFDLSPSVPFVTKNTKNINPNFTESDLLAQDIGVTQHSKLQLPLRMLPASLK